jgi:hypothetical protein
MDVYTRMELQVRAQTHSGKQTRTQRRARSTRATRTHDSDVGAEWDGRWTYPQHPRGRCHLIVLRRSAPTVLTVWSVWLFCSRALVASTSVSRRPVVCSFYPQIYLNHTRKSVTGLSFEYQAYNITG